MSRSLAVRPGERGAPVVTAALGMLLALISVLGAVVAQPAPASATEGAATEIASPRALLAEWTERDRAPIPVQAPSLCQPAEHSAEHAKEPRPHAPAKQELATARKAGIDHLGWIHPDTHQHRVSSAPDTGIRGPSDPIVRHRSRDTFDSRAPPLTLPR